MRNETSKIDPKTRKYAEKTLTGTGWGSPVGLGLFIAAAGIVAICAFAALLHVMQVIP